VVAGAARSFGTLSTFGAPVTPSSPLGGGGPIPLPLPVPVPGLPAPSELPVPGQGSAGGGSHDGIALVAAYIDRRAGGLFDPILCGRILPLDEQVVARPSTIVVPPG